MRGSPRPLASITLPRQSLVTLHGGAGGGRRGGGDGSSWRRGSRGRGSRGRGSRGRGGRGRSLGCRTHLVTHKSKRNDRKGMGSERKIQGSVFFNMGERRRDNRLPMLQTTCIRLVRLLLVSDSSNTSQYGTGF